jgi:DNA-binding CsgD family transcriptional regulator
LIKQFMRIPQHAPPQQLDDLTGREHDVFRLIARGLTNAEIGQELYISDTTVKTHITHILQKLNLRDRGQAVVLAYETGLFDNGARSSSDRDEKPAIRPNTVASASRWGASKRSRESSTETQS